MSEAESPRRPLAPPVKALLVWIVAPSLVQIFVPVFDAFALRYLSLRLYSFSGAGTPVQAVYGLITHTAVHGGALHLAFNSLWLLVIGQTLAPYLANRTVRYESPYLQGIALWALFFTGAMAGGVLQLALSPNAVLVGASGGIFAFFGAFGRIQLIIEGQTLSSAERRVRLVRFLAMMSVMILLFSLPTFSLAEGARISFAAHLGGFLVGVLGLPLFLRLAQKV